MEIAVISGKGGTGKSSITAAFASIEKSLVLADCDVDAANLFLLFNPLHEEIRHYEGGQKAYINPDRCLGCGLCAKHCHFEAIRFRNGLPVVNTTLCEGCRLCQRLCPVSAIRMVAGRKSKLYSGSFRYGRMVYGRLAPAEENSGKLVSLVRESAKRNASEHSMHLILLDGPPGIGCTAISTITGTDRVVIVTEPSLSGLHDLQRAVQMVKKFSIPIFVIINKADLNAEMTAKVEHFSYTEGLVVAGHLPFDTGMVAAMVSRKSIIEFNSDLPISRELKRIWTFIKQS